MSPPAAGVLGFSTNDALLLALVVVMLSLLALLAIAETAINRVSRVKAQALVDEGRPGSAFLLRLVAEPERFLNPVLLTVNLLQVVQAVLTTVVAERLFGPAGVVVATLVNVGLVYVFTEAIPKTWAVLNTERAALRAARPTAVLVGFAPLRWASNLLIGLANWILPGKGLEKGPFVSEQELLGLVEAAAEEEVIEREERELIESIIEFGDTLAREIMVPRPDMITVPATAKVSEALDVALEHGYSRVPVLGDSVDDVIGIAHAKDLAKAERGGQGFQTVAAVMREARFVPETKPVALLMREMQSGKYHLAVLVDEYGGVSGLVSLEDCLEELVGEIVDEYDVEEAEVVELDSGELLVDAGMPIDELAELLDVRLPDEDWDTVGGFVFGTLGHVPVEGEYIEAEGHRFTAEKVEGRRISLVRVTVVLAAGDAATDDR